MARGRMISRSLGGSRKFARLRTAHPDVGLFAQALYPLLLANSDDFGRQPGDAFSVKMAAWPAAPEDETTFDRALDALHSAELIVRYRAAGKTYVQIVDFDEHQSGLHKRTVSKCPAPSSDVTSTIAAGSGTFREIPGGSAPIELNRTEGKGTERKAARGAAVRDPMLQRFERFWTVYPRQDGRLAALEAWREIDPDDRLAADIVAGVNCHRATQTWKDAIRSGDLQFVPLPKTYLREGRWMDLSVRGARGRTSGACRHGHTPPCPDDVACTSRYLAELRVESTVGSAEVVAS